MKNVYIFDLDGTLANCDHRVDLATAKQWDDFHAASETDQPYPDVVRLWRKLDNVDCREQEESTELIIVTGRDEKYRGITEQWLKKHGIFPEAVLMRPEGDYTPDYLMKLKLIDGYFDGNRQMALDEVNMIFEDRDSVIEGLRTAGFTVCQVRPSKY